MKRVPVFECGCFREREIEREDAEAEVEVGTSEEVAFVRHWWNWPTCSALCPRTSLPFL